MPYLVSIRDDWMYTNHVGSGSILNSRFVITTARIIDIRHGVPSNLKVHANVPRTWDWTPDVYTVEENFIHPDFNHETDENDIGLLRTETEIAFHARVQPIPLSSIWLSNQDAVFSGYGFNDGSSTIGAPIAVVDFRTISNDECIRILGTQNGALVFDTKACVLPADNRVICRNDNGAALTVNGQLVGTSSWNVPCAHNSPIVVERISAHLDFIRQYVN